MDFAVAPAPPVLVPVVGDKPFAVHHVYCVGRNYAAHAREMGHDPNREAPFFFAKPAHAVVAEGATMDYPTETADLQPEVEMVVGLAVGGRAIPVAQALDHVYGYAVGLDMTRRDMQKAAKDLGRPWDMSKGFDQSAPLSALIPATALGPLTAGAIELTVNGTVRQVGDLAEMIWNTAEIISALSALVTLHPGDLIFTGTPAGVGPVVKGDRLVATVSGLPTLTITIV